MPNELTLHAPIEEQIGKVPDSIRFKKIKYGGEPLSMEVTYQKMNDDGGWDDLQLKTKQAPHPDFIDALRGLNGHLQEMTEQFEEHGEPAICDVRSVSVSWTNDIMGVVISGSRTLRDSHQPLNINTPHKTTESYSDFEDEKQLLSDVCVIAVEELFVEAWAFVNGKRNQADLFDDV